jgi:hypothetical protein
MTFAANINSSAYCLTKLAKDPYASIRWYVASNINTPASVIFELFKDEDDDVSNAAALELRRRKLL